MLAAKWAPTVMFAVVSIPIAVAAVSVYGLALYRRRNPVSVATVLSTR
jgi:AAHS family 4-hydroxybenzoate transporter-like MFS transporter